MMQQDIAKVLIDRGAIARRVQALAEQITRDLIAQGRAEAADRPERTLPPRRWRLHWCPCWREASFLWRT